MNQSILPEALEAPSIGGMLPGETGYTVPWAMFADEERLLWINAAFSIFENPGGTVHMLITRTEDGVIVDASTIGDQQYKVGRTTFEGELTALPVLLK